MNCPSCGTTNSEGAFFCRSCGSSLTPAPATPVAAPAIADTTALPAAHGDRPRPKRRAGLVLAVAMVIALALGAGGFAVYRSRQAADGKAALAAASGFVKAYIDKDPDSLAELVPPSTSKALGREWFDDFASGLEGWDYRSTDAGADETVLHYVLPNEQRIRLVFRQAEDGVASRITFETFLGDSKDLTESGTIQVERVEGSWRVVRYTVKPYDLVFWSDGLPDAKGIEALRTQTSANTSQAAQAQAQQPETAPQLDEEQLSEGQLPAGHPQIGSDPDADDGSGSAPDSGAGSAPDAASTHAPDPVGLVKRYFEAILADDYQTAWALLPEDKRKAQDASSFETQVKGYGISGFEIVDQQVGANEAKVSAKMMTSSNGDFGYEWTLRKDADGWYAVARKLSGMQ